MIFHTSGVRGITAAEKKVPIPSNNDVFEVGRDRSVGILTEVVLKDMDSVASGVNRFTDVDGSSGEGDKVEDVFHSIWKVLECVGRNDHPTVEC